jgi:hypothetical protein
MGMGLRLRIGPRIYCSNECIFRPLCSCALKSLRSAKASHSWRGTSCVLLVGAYQCVCECEEVRGVAQPCLIDVHTRSRNEEQSKG